MAAAAPKPALHRKPAACRSCSLFERGHGFVPPDGPDNALIAIQSEAPGPEEAAVGRPMIGAAGSMLERIFRRNGWQRGQVRIFNTINCLPPGMELRGAPYEYSAIDHCAVHRAPVLASPHQVIVAAGAVALRNRLHLEGLKSIRLEDFHGTVHADPERPGKWVVPTFHPSFLQRGAHNLIGTVSFDLQLAKEVALGQWTHQPIDRILDPPLEWVRAAIALLQQQVAADPGSVMIASDMETPDKAGGRAENELTPDDTSYQILRFNFSWHPDQGCTLPYVGDYIPLIHALAELPCWHLWWNGYGYDWARCAANGFQLPWRWQLDGMVAAHVLQSDVPLGLGFWAPFYSRYGAWKHLSESDPVDYAAIDGPQTFRTVSGIIGDLVAANQWATFHDHCHILYHDVLKPAQDVGILIDQPALAAFHRDLEVKQRRLIHEIQGCIPDDLRPLTGETSKPPEEGVLHPSSRTHALRTGDLLKSQPDPVKKDLYALVAQRVHRRVPRLIQVCKTCGKVEVSKTHVCKDERGKPAFVNDPANPAKFIPAVPNVVAQLWEVSRWFWQEPFNPDSAPQILAYLKARGHKPGTDKHTRKPSANRDTLLRLSKSTKDPLYKCLLDYKAVKKVDSTYAIPTMRRVQADPEGRLHPIPTFRPSTQRLSYVAPNITNVVQDKGGKESLAAGFRRAVVAGPGCRLLEVDFASAEPTEVGWLIRDPSYLRLATLGAHAYVTSHLLRRPPELSWSDADLGAYLKAIKSDPAHAALYDKCKRANNGINYGLTAYGMAETFPEVYKDQADAQKIVDLIFDLAPNLPLWQAAVQQRAYDVGYLGGVGPVMTGATVGVYAKDRSGKAIDQTPFHHPFGYQHWFWSVLAYKPITEKQRIWREKRGRLCVEINGRWFSVDRGEDSKRVIAWGPQSIAAGVLKRSMLQLFAYPDHPSYIGDAYFGRTPLRAPIHDSLLLEVPNGQWDRVVEAVAREMQRPIVEQPLPKEWGMGEYLSIGADAKVGQNWKDTEKLTLPGWREVGTESSYFGVEDEDAEDAAELGVVA